MIDTTLQHTGKSQKLRKLCRSIILPFEGRRIVITERKNQLNSQYKMAFACIPLALISIGNRVSNRTLIEVHRSIITRRYYYRPIVQRNVVDVAPSAETNRGPTIGIVAAIARDGVIGVDGGLPWNSPISLDRDHFVNLTRGRILIIGRKTFANEDPSGAHIGHVRVCIVVSRTMDPSDLVERNGAGIVFPMVKLARSFDEALDVASDAMLSSGEGKREGRAIECWVAGGERIYREAIRYGASEVHLTHVDVAVDQTTDREIAYFPLDCLREHGYEETSRRDIGRCSFRVLTKDLQRK
jgi:dihydrofolate reductase